MRSNGHSIGTNYNAARAKNSLKDPVNGKRQQALGTPKYSNYTTVLAKAGTHLNDPASDKVLVHPIRPAFQLAKLKTPPHTWIPACAGMTVGERTLKRYSHTLNTPNPRRPRIHARLCKITLALVPHALHGNA